MVVRGTLLIVCLLYVLAAGELSGEAVSLVQLKAQAVEYSQHADDGDTIEVQDVMDKLSVINESIEKVKGLVTFVNDTALDMMSQSSVVSDAFKTVLPALKFAADALAALPGGKDVATWAAGFITAANKSVDNFDDTVGTIPDVVSKVMEEVVPELQNMADRIFEEFRDAAEQVAALQNESAAAEGTDLFRVQSNVHRIDVTTMLESHAGGRVEQLLGSTASLERSVAAKGKGLSKCAKATAAIKKANATVSKFFDQLDGVNKTAAGLLEEVLAVATTGLQTLNTTVETALDPASDVVPSKLLAPFTKGISALMEVGDDLLQTVTEALPEIQAQVTDSEGELGSLPEIAESLQEAADAACKQAKASTGNDSASS